jgi:hypothetical protein
LTWLFYLDFEVRLLLGDAEAIVNLRQAKSKASF